MADSIRFHSRDSMLALLCRYLMSGTRDLSLFDPSIPMTNRKVNVDSTDFRIVRVVPGQAREKPGINLVFFDDHKWPPAVGSDRRYGAVAIHIYKPTTSNPVKDERSVIKLVRKVDEALYGGACGIYNFDVSPAEDLGPALFWKPVKTAGEDSWRNQTDLSREPNIHYTRNFSVWWDEKSIS